MPLEIYTQTEPTGIGSKSGEGKDVCPGIIFPRRPSDKQRMELIEQMFSDEGIPVVWHDETIRECKARQGCIETPQTDHETTECSR
jgi:hypothetical protein